MAEKEKGLDVNEILEEVKKEEKKEEVKSSSKEEEKASDEKKEEEKPKKNFKKIIFLGLWIVLFMIGTSTGYLAYKEANKKYLVSSPYIKVNPKVIYITEKKKIESKIKSEIKSYNFNLTLAYEFNGISSKRILTCQVTCIFKSKYRVDMQKLYSYIKSNIFHDFKKLVDDKFLEEIPNYISKLSVIIQQNVENGILKAFPDVNKKEIEKTLNFVVYRIK